MARYRSPRAHATGQTGGAPPAFGYPLSPNENGRFEDGYYPQAARAVQTPAGPSYPVTTARMVRRRTHRHRYGLRPWLVITPIVAGANVAHLIPATHQLWWAPLLGGAVYAGAVQLPKYRKRPGKQARKHLRYALACTASASSWLSLVDACGMFHGLGRLAVVLVAVPGLFPLSWWWWNYHRIRPTGEITERPAPAPDEVLIAWEMHVSAPKGLLPGAQLRPRRATEGVREYLIVGVRGHHTTKGLTSEDTLHKLASALGLDPEMLELERPPKGPDRNGFNARLLVVNPSNDQLRHELPWDGPTLDVASGLFSPAVYADGPAYCRLYQTANGRPHRAVNNAISGLMGYGKSRLIELMVLEMLWSGMFVVWYGDGQEGTSGPSMRDHVDWYAVRRDELLRMLKAAFRVAKARQRYDQTIVWTDSHGHQRTGRGFWPASPQEPFLQVILDEFQEFLADIRVAKLVKTLQRLGPKLGIGVSLVTQEWLMYETGGQSGDPSAQSIRTFAQTGLVAMFKAGSDINARALGGSLAGMDPRTLPDDPGWLYMLSKETRQVRARTRHANSDDIYDWLARTHDVKAHLDDVSVRAAGDDYRDRWQRYNELPTADSEDSLADIEKELDELMGDGPAAKNSLASVSIKSAVYEIVKEHGPVKRGEIDSYLAAGGRSASKSTIDQALASFADTHALERLGNGIWDVPDRSDRAAGDAEKRAAALELSGQADT